MSTSTWWACYFSAGVLQTGLMYWQLWDYKGTDPKDLGLRDKLQEVSGMVGPELTAVLFTVSAILPVAAWPLFIRGVVRRALSK